MVHLLLYLRNPCANLSVFSSCVILALENILKASKSCKKYLGLCLFFLFYSFFYSNWAVTKALTDKKTFRNAYFNPFIYHFHD